MQKLSNQNRQRRKESFLCETENRMPSWTKHGKYLLLPRNSLIRSPQRQHNIGLRGFVRNCLTRHLSLKKGCPSDFEHLLTLALFGQSVLLVEPLLSKLLERRLVRIWRSGYYFFRKLLELSLTAHLRMLVHFEYWFFPYWLGHILFEWQLLPSYLLFVYKRHMHRRHFPVILLTFHH